MTGTAEGITEGAPPVVTQTQTRTHCDSCGGELAPDMFHKCPPPRPTAPPAELSEKHFDGSKSFLQSAGEANAEAECSRDTQDLIRGLDKALDATERTLEKINRKLGTSETPTLVVPPGHNLTSEQVLQSISPDKFEQAKYEEMWKHPEYRQVAPGEHCAQHFLEIARPRPGSHIIDFGCGTGRGTFSLGLFGKGIRVTMLDFAANCLDPEMQSILAGTSEYNFPGLEFHQQDLTATIPYTSEFGFCTDVMEHIPPDQVDLVLLNILKASQHVFFQISCVDDSCGKMIGHPLHLSVHPPGWWLAKFAELKCQVIYFRDLRDAVIVYVTAWATGKEIVEVGELNTEMTQIRENVKANMAPAFEDQGRTYELSTRGSLPDLSPKYAKAAFLVLSQSDRIRQEIEAEGLPFNENIIDRVTFAEDGNCHIRYLYALADHVSEITGHFQSIEVKRKDFAAALVETEGRWKQVFPHQPNDHEVIILGGGPGLERDLPIIRQLRDEGKKLVTLNGAYHWALEKGLKVSATVVVDARPFNARFTHPVVPETLYFVGSQCDPTVLEGLPHDRTWLWHTTAEDIRDILEDRAPDSWFGVVGGCTVLLRAIPLLRMLGYSRFHLFGCDSCVEGITSVPREGLLTREATHHAYSQPENDENVIYPAIVGGRTFYCTAWQIAQAQNFMDMIRVMGELFELQVYGDGLLAWILRHGYELDLEREAAEEEETSQSEVT